LGDTGPRGNLALGDPVSAKDAEDRPKITALACLKRVLTREDTIKSLLKTLLVNGHGVAFPLPGGA
jgi:hypothetical protein